jgi:hypothetical protein
VDPVRSRAELARAGQRILNGIERLEGGITDRAAVYPRRVMEGALRRQAAALVLVKVVDVFGNDTPKAYDTEVR